MAGLANRSLVTEKELRKKVAIAVCRKINELLKASNPNIDPKNLYSDEEVEKWVNNPKSVSDYRESFQQDKVDRLESISKDQIGEKEFSKNGGCRFYHLFMSDKDIEASKIHNFRAKNYSLNENLRKTFGCDLFNTLNSTDPKVFLTKNIDEARSLAEEDIYLQKIGFNLNFAANYFDGEDTTIINRMKNNSAIFESDIGQLNKSILRSPFYMLIPPNHDLSGLKIDSSTERQIKEAISAISKDIKEIKSLSDSEFVYQDKTSIFEYVESCKNINIQFKNNEKLCEMIDAGIIQKGCLSDYYFVDSEGNEVSTGYAMEHFENGKLNGVQKVYVNEEEKRKHIDSINRIRNKAKVTEMEIIAKQLSNKQLSNEQESLLSDINGVLKEFETVKNEDNDKIKEFFIINELKMDTIEKGIQNIYENKVRAYEEKIQKDNASFIKNSSDNMKLSYAELANNANNINTISHKDGKLALDPEKIRKNLLMIHDINQKDEQYKKRNFIARWWYKNSHQMMLDSKKALVENLSSFNISKDVLEKIGKEPGDINKLSKLQDNLEKTNAEKIEKALLRQKYEAEKAAKREQKKLEENLKKSLNSGKKADSKTVESEMKALENNKENVKENTDVKSE